MHAECFALLGTIQVDAKAGLTASCRCVHQSVPGRYDRHQDDALTRLPVRKITG